MGQGRRVHAATASTSTAVERARAGREGYENDRLTALRRVVIRCAAAVVAVTIVGGGIGVVATGLPPPLHRYPLLKLRDVADRINRGAEADRCSPYFATDDGPASVDLVHGVVRLDNHKAYVWPGADDQAMIDGPVFASSEIC